MIVSVWIIAVLIASKSQQENNKCYVSLLPMATYIGKKTEFKWSIKESDLALTFPLTQKTVLMNAKISGGSLRLAMNADKLLTIINTVSEKASSINSTASSINALIKNVKGMYVGLKFTKKTKSKE